jgi:hypothetical protein
MTLFNLNLETRGSAFALLLPFVFFALSGPVPSKTPLPRFVEECYFKRFGKRAPEKPIPIGEQCLSRKENP